jgi:two-component system CheB/CheR fusion protein
MSSRRSSKKSQADTTEAQASTEQQQDHQQELFPIVGMGASAGGLEAFTQLLSHLPNDTGMAFVLVQHLSPDHKSILSEILSRTTQMPVHEVQDGMLVEPNHVYVIPPNKNMTISHGVLKLTPRTKTRGQYMTIDTFFFSLAEYKSRAITVVLSGSDGDGTRGLQKIKEAGGITFAQCKETAQISSMPNTAIASGYVDFILPPQEIASELVKISHHPYINRSSVESTEKQPEKSEALSTIFSLLRATSGVDFNYYKPTTLKRRILRRMALYHIERLEDYATSLQTNPTDKDMELQKQADQIVLNQYAPAGVITNYDLEIVQFRGQCSPYLEPAPGKASLNLLKMTKEGLRPELRNAIHQAKEQLTLIRKEDLQLIQSDQLRFIRIDVIPFKPFTDERHYFLIIFIEIPFPGHLESVAISDRPGKRQSQHLSLKQENILLKQELANTKEYLQSIIKEHQATNQNLKAANEEILSSNEELQSTNEELQTAKEEIQATNEELNTINDELQRRNAESIQATNDLQNVLSSINIPILIIESDLRVRRFTPLAAKVFNLIPTDVGRPLSDIKHNLNIPNLEQEILEVISTLNLKAQEVQDQDGHWYDLRIRPYKTSDNKIDGAVVVLVDIDSIKTRT